MGSMWVNLLADSIEEHKAEIALALIGIAVIVGLLI